MQKTGKSIKGRPDNRNRANKILAAVFLLFIAATALKYTFPGSFWAGLLAFTAEAALIGGVADWFAVTALFTKPLGFSWHTAIIPRNRDLIIEKVSEVVSKELLSAESLKNRLAEMNITDAVIGRISGSLDEIPLEERIRGFFENKAEALDKEKLSSDIDSFIKDNLKKESVSDEIAGMLNSAFREGRHGQWLSMLLDKALEVAKRSSTREKIYKILKEQEKLNEAGSGAGSFLVRALLNASRNSKHTNTVSISELLQKELVDAIQKINNPDHPIFRKILENSKSLLERTNEDRILLDAVQKWKNGILDRVDLLENLESLVASAVESQSNRNEAAGFLAGYLDFYREDLGKDAGMRQWVDGILRSMLEKLIISEHHVIGEIARDTLSSFTNEKLVEFIEEKAGNDLQWIRINGSIVGSAAGALIYLFANLAYSPFIVPAIRQLLGL